MWQCPMCETLNEDDLNSCRICQGKEPTSAPPPPTDSGDEMVREAQAFLQRNERGKAWETYARHVHKYPHDYRGWFGMAKMSIDNFSRLDMAEEGKQRVLEWLKNAARVAPPEKQMEIEAIISDYERSAELSELLRKQKEAREQAEKEALLKKKQAPIKREAALFILGTLIPALAAILFVYARAAIEGALWHGKIDAPAFWFPAIWLVLCLLSFAFWKRTKGLIFGVWLHWITALYVYWGCYRYAQSFFSWSKNGIRNFYEDLLKALLWQEASSGFTNFVIWPWVWVELLSIACVLIWMMKKLKSVKGTYEH